MKMINNIVHPGFVMMGFSLLIALMPSKAKGGLSILGACCAAAAGLTLSDSARMTYAISKNFSIELMKVDDLTRAFLFAFCIISILIALYSYQLTSKTEAGVATFYAGCVMSVVLAGDCLSFLIFWELSAVASSYLIYARQSRESSRAAFRYMLVHALGGNILLVGIMLHIYHRGMEIVNISQGPHDASFWLILIGLGINAAIPPLNSWLTDAYPVASMCGTVYLGSFTTKAAIYALIRFLSGTEMLVWAGCFMAIYAAAMAIMENDIARLLCYHIVSQLGMMIAALGTGSPLGIDGASAHAVTNIMFKGVLLMCTGSIVYGTGKRKITELGGLAKKMPVTSTCFLISSLAIAGLPLLSGFASKGLIMESLAEGQYTIPELLISAAGVGTLLSITLKINWFVFFGPSDLDVPIIRKQSYSMDSAVIIGTLISVIFGTFPKILYRFTMYHSDFDPFTLSHVMEYLAIFLGGSIPFFLYIKKMKPHDEFTIDFDWFYRKPLKALFNGIASVLFLIGRWFDVNSLKAVHRLSSCIVDPEQITGRSHVAVIRSMSFENEDRRIGTVIGEAVGTVIILWIVLAFM